MKRILLSFAVIALSVIGALATEVTFDFKSSTYGAGPAYTDGNTSYVSTSNVATQDNVTVTFSTNPTQAWRFWSDGIRAYKGKSATFTVKAPQNAVITAVSWTTSNNGATFAETSNTSQNITKWSGSQEEVAFVYTNTGSNYALVTLTVNYEYVNTDLSPAGITFPEESVTVDLTDGTYSGQTLTNPNGLVPTYSSSDDKVATVNPSTGVVTLLSEGKTTITATTEETSQYAAGSASYTLIVEDPTAISTELTPSFFGHTATSYKAVTKTDSYDVGYSAVYYTSSGAFQFNTNNGSGKGSGVAVNSMNSKYKIASIDIEMTSNNNGVNVYKNNSAFPTLETGSAPELGTAELVQNVTATTYSISINDYAFAVLPKTSGAVVVQKITVHYVENTSSVQPAGLQFAKSTVDVPLGESFPGNELTKATTAAVTYTSSNTNVAEVDANSGNITLKDVIGSTTITASVPPVEGKFEDGSVAYTLNVLPAADQVLTVPEAIVAIDNGYRGTATVTGIISQIDGYNSTYNSITYWISEDGQTQNQFEVYSGKGLNGANFTAVTDIELGATVEVKGSLTLYGSTYEFSQNSQLVSYTPPVTDTLGKILVTVSDGQTLENEGSITVTQGTTFTFTAANATDWELESDKLGTATETNTDTYIFTADELCEDEYIIVTASFNDSEEAFGFTLTVIEKIEANAEAQIVWADQGYANEQVITEFVQEPITITLSKGTGTVDPKFYTSSPGTLRMYAGNTMTIKLDEGSYMTGIDFKTNNSNFTTTDGAYNATVSSGTLAANSTSATWTASAPTQEMTITFSSAVRIVNMTIHYYTSEESQPQSPDLSFGDDPDCEVTLDAADVNSELPELENPYGVSPITYDSSDTTVATIDEDGQVTLVGAGTTTISASFAGNETYKAQTVSYTLTVIDPIKGTKVTIDWTSNYQDEITGSNGVPMTQYKQDGITVTGDTGSNTSNAPRWWQVSASQGGGTQLRVYNGNTITVSVPENYYITGIELFSIQQNGKGELTEDTYADVGYFEVDNNYGLWTPEAPAAALTRADNGKYSTVTFNIGSTVYITGTNVYYDVVTGVEALGADQDGEAEYFTLQGVKVANPDKGIYIVRRNGKASKVVIR